MDEYYGTGDNNNNWPLRRVAVGVLQSADLEHIRVVPALTQCGVGEYEPCRLVKGQQPFLVFQNEVVGGNIIRELSTTLERRVDAATGLFVDAEIALVRVSSFNAAEILLIRRIKHRQMLVQNVEIFLLKDTTVLAQDFVSVLVILTVLCNLVDEK